MSFENSRYSQLSLLLSNAEVAISFGNELSKFSVILKELASNILVLVLSVSMLLFVGSQVSIHQSPTLSNVKKRVAGKYYKSKQLVLELSPQLNRSLGCMRGLGICVSLEGLQLSPEKLQYEGFSILVQKNCTVKDLQFWSIKNCKKVCNFFPKNCIWVIILLVEQLWMQALKAFICRCTSA